MNALSRNLSRRSFIGASAMLSAWGALALAGCSTAENAPASPAATEPSGDGASRDVQQPQQPSDSVADATKDESATENSTQEPADNSRADGENGLGNVLVVYYSAQGHTKAVADAVTSALDADSFELAPETPYTTEDLNWRDESSRVNAEHNDPQLRDIPLVQATPEGFADYDTILLGYPIWWGGASWVMNRFVQDNDFSGKTVIPFCTSQSSGAGESAVDLEALAGTGAWQEATRFSESVAPEAVQAWAATLRAEQA